MIIKPVITRAHAVGFKEEVKGRIYGTYFLLMFPFIQQG
jgi:hypothetical protein